MADQSSQTHELQEVDVRDLYETDFYGWLLEQSRLLREGRVAEIDAANIAEEIESLGRSERREFRSRLEILLLHLLKWQWQPDLRGKSWQATIAVQRRDLARHLEQNPSLKPHRDDALLAAYEDAARRAEMETSLTRDVFPFACPWSFEQVVDDGFWPEG